MVSVKKAQEIPDPLEDEAAVVAGGGEDRIDGVPLLVGKVVPYREGNRLRLPPRFRAHARGGELPTIDQGFFAGL